MDVTPKKKMKSVMSSFAGLPAHGEVASGIYLLYVSGEGDVDYDHLQKCVECVPHFVLGSGCWFLKLPGSEVLEF